MKMNININKITISFKQIEGKKHENLLAQASITLKDENQDYLVISGITVWKSKNFKGLNVEPPNNKRFKFCYGSLWQKIKKEILKQYEYWEIPVIDKE